MKTIFVLPLSAALMLGTAAYAQNADQPMNNTVTQPGQSAGQPSSDQSGTQSTNGQTYGQPADQTNGPQDTSQSTQMNDQTDTGQSSQMNAQPADQSSGQSGQPSAQPGQSPQTNDQSGPGYGQPAAQPGAADQSNGQENGQQNSMSNATMYGSSASQMDPRQSTNGGMPIDQETTVGGIQAACTGVGDTEESRGRWSDYPVKLVVSGTNHQFFAGETVSVSKSDGTQVAQMTCNGPWVLMKLDPGSYHATVDLPGHEAKTVAFTAPSRGQREVNVVYAGAQETSDETSAGANQYRATPTGFQQPGAPPSAQPQNNNTVTAPPQNNPVPNTNENNNSDQNPQTPQ